MLRHALPFGAALLAVLVFLSAPLIYRALTGDPDQPSSSEQRWYGQR